MSDLRIAATRAGEPNGNGAGEGGDRFEHAAHDSAHAVVQSPARRPRPTPASAERAKVLRQRRRPPRLLIAFTAFTAFCTFWVGMGYVYVQRRLAQINRVDLPALGADSGSVMNVLLVGSDTRANLEGTVAAGFGKDEVGGQRSDTVMILHVDPGSQKAAIISVPRDLYVPIAGTNSSDRVNVAFALGGPDQLIATVQQALGITIHHYVEVDFVGFKDIVDTVGGVTMYIPYQVRDSAIGLTLPAGCKELDGQQALSWVRSRTMEFLVNGTWQADGRGDLGRVERQQDFIRRLMKKALNSGLTNPLQLNRLIGIGVKDVTFDSGLSTKDLTALGRRFSSLDPDRVLLSTFPTSPADIDGKSVLKLQTAQAQPMIDLLNGRVSVDGTPTPATGATTSTAPASAVKSSDVRVRVLNGVGTPGAASKAGTTLTGAGYVVTDRGDAPALAAKTTISHGPGQLAKAQLLQSALLTPAVIREDATLKSADLSLVLGADYTGFKATVSSGGTPTTVAPSTTIATEINPVPLPKGTTAPPC
jgi:polyisoprenyl-teichoic acid--peptidoglycan teichoic acid transferase